MTSKEKIEYMLNEVREKARISSYGVFKLNCSAVVDGSYDVAPEDAPVIFSRREQIDILYKFKKDRLLFDVTFEDDDRDAIIILMNLDISNNENPYDEAGRIKVVEDSKTDLNKGLLKIDNSMVQLSTKAGKENNPLRLLKTLMKEPSKYWYEDEILEDWEGVGFEQRKVRIPRNRVYHSAKNLNKKILENTGITNYIEHDTAKFRVNPNYLSKL